MLARSLPLAALVLAACSSSSKPPAPPATPAFACIADKLDLLHLELAKPPCTDEPTGCAKACHDGDGQACWQHGLLLQGDPATALPASDAFQRACTLGVANGCTNYANALWLASTDDASRYECARHLFEAACAVADPYACGMDGRLRIDRGTGGDTAAGQGLLEKACRDLRGFPCRVLALEYERGKLGAAPPDRIPQLMLSACDGGDTPACGEHATVEETFR